MGHLADDTLPDLKRYLGVKGDAQDELVLENLHRAEAQMKLLVGRSPGRRSNATLRLDSCGLPFVEVPDLVGRPRKTSMACWPIPDPVRPSHAGVVQIGAFSPRPIEAASVAAALRRGGEMVSTCAMDDDFTHAISRWLGARLSEGRLGDALSGMVSPDRHLHVPVAAGAVDGWWLQITRRLRLIGPEPDDDHRLVEPIARTGDGQVLVATEPTLLIARITEHPVEWAMLVRLWPIAGSKSSSHWRLPGVAQAVRSYGIPIVTVDQATTAREATAQLLLAAHWYGYLGGEDHEIPPALVRAFPREVRKVRTVTDSADDESAAALLFARLLSPGFDPGRSAETMRHYIRRHATVLVREHRTAAHGQQPWQRIGISERHYYRQLARVASKSSDGTYDIDDATRDRLHTQLEARQSQRERRQAAVALLRSRGFAQAAARKWLQRHPIEEIRAAVPRPPAKRNARPARPPTAHR